MKLTDKDMNELARYAQSQGWEITQNAGHIRFRSPKGETAVTGSTLSDRRGIRNHIAQLRRMGLEVPRKAPKAKQKVTPIKTIMIPLGESPSDVKVIEMPNAPIMPHITAILGQWRSDSWFVDGFPITEDQWDYYTDETISQSAASAWMQCHDGEMLSPRKFRIWIDCMKFWTLGELEDDENFPETCTCGQSWRHSPDGMLLLALHLIKHHEMSEFEHKPDGVFVLPWTDPGLITEIMDDEAEEEIERLKQELDDCKVKLKRFGRMYLELKQRVRDFAESL